jgi:hypothetical protein
MNPLLKRLLYLINHGLKKILCQAEKIKKCQKFGIFVSELTIFTMLIVFFTFWQAYLKL